MTFKEIFHPVVLILLMEYTIGNNPAGCIISTNPQDTVVLLNGTAEFNCAVDTETQGATTFIIFTFKTGTTRQSLSLSQGDNGITWQSMVDETFVTYDIQVIATEENNGLRIRCGFPSCFTEEAQLIIVNGPPLPPAPPSVVLSNLTTMSITWSPPWIYPVDNYTLIIRKGSDDDSIPAILDTVTVATEGYLFHKEQGSDDCDGIYRFSVSVDTNVGNTGFSNETIAVFPKDLLSIQQPLTVGMEEITCRSSSFFNITSMRPSVCLFEVLIYEIQVSTLEDNDIHRVIDVTVPDSTEPNGLFYITSTDHRESIQQFNITLTVTNQADQSLSTTITIDSSSIQATAFDGQDNVQHPRTTVALPDTMVTFTCSDDQTTLAQLEINDSRINTLHPNAVKTDYNDRGISWEEIISGGDAIGFTVSINVSMELNGISIQCFFSPCATDKAYLIVVSAPPDPLDAPTVTPTVSNCLVISWSPPWSHPVNEYTVFIRSNAGITLNNTITDGHSYELMMESAMFNYSTCEDLYFSVEGSTDVGQTGRSNETKLGFIKGVEGIDIAKLQGISRSYNISTYYNGSMELTIFVQPLQLDLCSYESIRYTITVMNNRSSDSVTVDTMNISSTTVNLDYTNQHGDSLRVILNMYDDANRNISLTLFQAISFMEPEVIKPSSSILVPSMSTVVNNISASPTVTPEGEPTASRMPVATIAVIASCVIVLIVIALLSVLFGVLFCHLRKRQRATIACRSNGNTAAPFTIPSMVTNDNYENPQEIMYDSIPLTLKDLKSQTPSNSDLSQQQHNGYTLATSSITPTTPLTPCSGVDAPLLPPPREGTRTPTPSLPLRERRNMDPIPPLSLKDEDDYVPMSANPIANCSRPNNNTTVGSANGGGTVFIHSPRYTEPPSLNVSSNSGNNSGGEGNGMPDSALYAVPGPATSRNVANSNANNT